MSTNIFLVGFSTTGKSRVGRLLAERLGWRFVDTDDEIVRLAGKPIPRIFAEDGEPQFREIERQALAAVAAGERTVVATGGGLVLDPANRALMDVRGLVVLLEARPATIHRRLLAALAEEGNPAVRPLLASPNPLARIEFLKEYRQPYYSAAAHWTVHTDRLTPEEVAAEVERAWEVSQRNHRSTENPALSNLRPARESEAPYCAESGAACVVQMPTATYSVFVGRGELSALGRRLRNAGLTGTAYVISDEAVYAAHGATAVKALEESHFRVDRYLLRPGEAVKSLATAEKVYDWLLERRAERGHTIVALGGGVVGDLAGFVAATYLRGVPLVQVPTTLLAMVDASLGGKTAVNHHRGKNLVGAFYQPRLVVADVATLETLPPRELTSGWAEVIKHAAILDPDLFTLLEDRAVEIRGLQGEIATQVIARSTAIKARVVSGDERESGERIILNFGHTMAHGIETATGYDRFLHGEAVAIGMVGAARLSQRLGMLPAEEFERLRDLLVRFALPTRCQGVDIDRVRAAMKLDKKVSGSAVRWVLLEGLGRVTVRRDVPPELVDDALSEVIG